MQSFPKYLYQPYKTFPELYHLEKIFTKYNTFPNNSFQLWKKRSKTFPWSFSFFLQRSLHSDRIREIGNKSRTSKLFVFWIRDVLECSKLNWMMDFVIDWIGGQCIPGHQNPHVPWGQVKDLPLQIFEEEPLLKVLEQGTILCNIPILQVSQKSCDTNTISEKGFDS